MEITINTKFDIGDKIYFVRHDAIQCGVITKISNLEKDYETEAFTPQYRVKYGKYDTNYDVREEEAFEDISKLTDYLTEEYLRMYQEFIKRN